MIELIAANRETQRSGKSGALQQRRYSVLNLRGSFVKTWSFLRGSFDCFWFKISDHSTIANNKHFLAYKQENRL